MRRIIKLDKLDESGCDRIDSCKIYSSTNPNLTKDYCLRKKLKRCFFNRSSEDTGLFTSPRLGEYFLS